MRMRDRLRVVVMLGALSGAASAQTAAEHATVNHSANHAVAKPSTSLSVSVNSSTMTITPAKLAGMTQLTVKVINGHTQKEETYTGVRLSDVLTAAGAKLGKETLHGYVVAKGTDGYWVLYSGEEIVSTVHGGEVIVALTADGKPLQDDGQMRLISTEDKKPERWVRNLSAVEWKTGAE